MADIELVIKIDKEIYERFKSLSRGDNFEHDICGNSLRRIANGTPLPKHGDLKDADVMINKLCTQEASEMFGSTTCAEIMDFINGEKPIIKSNKESEVK